MVALLPWQLARVITGVGGIAVLESESDERVELSVLWHTRSAADPAHIWLRGILEAAAATLN